MAKTFVTGASAVTAVCPTCMEAVTVTRTGPSTHSQTGGCVHIDHVEQRNYILAVIYNSELS
jgi:hypothetical protein